MESNPVNGRNSDNLTFTDAPQLAIEPGENLTGTLLHDSAAENQNKKIHLAQVATEMKRKVVTAFDPQSIARPVFDSSAQPGVFRPDAENQILNANSSVDFANSDNIDATTDNTNRNGNLVEPSVDNNENINRRDNQTRPNVVDNALITGHTNNVVGRPTALALRLVDIGGSADEIDKQIVASELSKLPSHLLQRLENAGTRIIVARNSVADAQPRFADERPRGWPPGSTWKDVPGVFDPTLNQVIIATTGHGTPGGARVPPIAHGHGSYNLVLHEIMHAIDLSARIGIFSRTGLSHSSAFMNAYRADFATLNEYHKQAPPAGPQEAFAETGARFYSGDATLANEHPNLYRFWAADPLNSRTRNLQRNMQNDYGAATEHWGSSNG